MNLMWAKIYIPIISSELLECALPEMVKDTGQFHTEQNKKHHDNTPVPFISSRTTRYYCKTGVYKGIHVFLLLL